MAGKGFEINKRGIEQMMREMQREFDKHSIRVPVEADSAGAFPAHGAAPGHVANYYGPVVQVNGDRAQVAWGGSVTQNQDGVQEVAPGYEALAAAVVEIRRGLAATGLGAGEQREAEAAADDLLREITVPEPDPGKVRRAATMLKGFLASVLIGGGEGIGEGAVDWVRTGIEQLGNLPF